MKEYDKRINNDDFEQVVKCYQCGSLFWSKSKYELGNWRKHCDTCEIEINNELEQKRKKVIELGVPVKSEDGRIKGWILNGEKVLNPDYEFNKEEARMVANGFYFF